MIRLLAPTMLAFAALAVPILLLWMLKLRRREVTVSSTLLWSKLLRDREANTPWQRLRRNLLLFLQLAILAALVLSLARPFRPVPVVTRGVVVLLLDSSASMNATDVLPSRFAAAQRAAEEMVRGLAGDGTMTVIAVGRQPRILAAATADKAALRQAIVGARPEQGTADWQGAFALAAGATRGASESTIVVLSDGAGLGLPADLPPLPGRVRYLPIGREGGTPNLAITALAVRDGVRGPELFLNVAHSGPGTPPDPQLAEPLLSLHLDGGLFDSRRITVLPGQDLPLSITDLPAETALIEARLLAPDALDLDNVAWAVRGPAGKTRVLIVTAGNLFLERALSNLPALEVDLVPPEAPTPAGQYDLYVLDGVLPDPIPAAAMLVLDPPAGNTLLTVTGAFSDTRISRTADDQRLAHVDLDQVQIARARAVVTPDWPGTRELVRAEGGPLLLVGEPDGRRVAVLTFDLHDSDLPLQVAFPVLIANLVDWLVPGLPFDQREGLRPGDPLVLYPGDARQIRVVRPDGGSTDLSSANLGTSPPTFVDTDQLGVYQVVLDNTPAGQFAVSLFDPAESTLSRQETIAVGAAEISAAAAQEPGQEELWPWLVAAALVLLLIEWRVYHGASPAPRRPSGNPFHPLP